MINYSLIAVSKLIAWTSRVFNFGHGSTWPGHVALKANKNFIKDSLKKNPHLKTILIAGTNGKTTTGKLIQTILENSAYRVFQNESGANLLNGIASTLIRYSNKVGRLSHDYAIFEIDENTLPLVLREITPNYLVLLNLFRDQLDRYGEVNTIASKWRKAIRDLSNKTIIILNADDPQIAYLGGVQANPPLRWNRSDTSVFYFGLKNKKLAQAKHQHAVDSTYCPNCASKLTYNLTYYSHLGDWECKKCDFKRPKNMFSSPLQSRLRGVYNLYNVLVATLVAKKIGVSDKIISKSIEAFTPAFGRQEILNINGKKAQIFLSKNPTSFNESLRTIANLKAKYVLVVLNDRIPDGQDVSWIWDVDTEELLQMESITVGGDRAFDMGLRIKYSSSSEIKSEKLKIKNKSVKFKIIKDLKRAIMQGLEEIDEDDTLYILPTYSAMLEVRKILTGKRIL